MRRPDAGLEPSRIVVTFSVEPLPPGGYTCPGNKPGRVVVHLPERIGARTLVDGACRPGGEAATTSYCIRGSTRWKP